MAKYSNGLEDDIYLTDASVKVLEGRYLKKDDSGKVIETAHDMLKRVAYNIAEADRIYESGADIEKTAEIFYQMMSNLYFLPNSPTLMNAGKKLQQLSACFVLPIPDDLRGIYESISNTAIVHQTGGGTGFNFSNLRPNGAIISSTKGRSPGPLSFLDVFNTSTGQITQGGTRRGANMGILKWNHPDVMDWIYIKEEEGRIENFNLSISFNDEFFKLLETGGFYELKDPRGKPYTLNEFDNRRTPIKFKEGNYEPVLIKKDSNVINRKNGKVLGKIENDRIYLNASAVFDEITERAWSKGEPGVIFIDKINRHNPVPEAGEIESTNPCGEQPLLPYESCNLGSINLSRFVENGRINYQNLESIVHKSVHFLDNVIDMNKYPLPQIEKITKANRKIGLGVMGFADMLIQLGIPYNSPEAIATTEKIMSFIQNKSKETSVKLAEKRGSFPNIEKSIYKGKSMRNATTTTIAPTGTLAIIAGCSQGIEPIFAIVYERKTQQFKLLEANEIFKNIAKERGFYSEELVKRIFEKEGNIKDFADIPGDIRKLFVSAHDVGFEWHVKMQAATQKYVDNAVSKTINFPKTATIEDVRNSFILAYRNNCKGITIYRNESKDEQVLSTKAPPKKEEIGNDGRMPRPRPMMTRGATIKMKTGCGNLYITVNNDEKGLCEVFSQMGKSGGCATSQSEAVSRLISLALRSGIEVDAVMKQIKGIRCPTPLWDKGGMILSCPDAIGKAIEGYLKADGKQGIKEETIEKISEDYDSHHMKIGEVVGVCPDCGSSLIQASGCATCGSCGFTKC